MRRASRTAAVVLVVTAAMVLASCAAGPNSAALAGVSDPAGFWLGLWHGLISPVTFVISLFTDNVNIYEVNNNGNWYDAGFMLGVFFTFSSAAGGGAAQTSRRSRAAR